MERYTKDIISKLGNTMIYIAERVNPLNKTKLLKLLYLIEEESVRKYRTPFFCIDFKVWKLGPVVQDVFIDLSNDKTDMFADYIDTKKINEETSIVPVGGFSDDEFSDNDLDVLDDIINRFGSHTAKKLVSLTHRRDSLWSKAKSDNNLTFTASNSSDVSIDFSSILKGEDKSFYTEVMENKRIFSNLKN